MFGRFLSAHVRMGSEAWNYPGWVRKTVDAVGGGFGEERWLGFLFLDDVETHESWACGMYIHSKLLVGCGLHWGLNCIEIGKKHTW